MFAVNKGRYLEECLLPSSSGSLLITIGEKILYGSQWGSIFLKVSHFSKCHVLQLYAFVMIDFCHIIKPSFAG